MNSDPEIMESIESIGMVTPFLHGSTHFIVQCIRIGCMERPDEFPISEIVDETTNNLSF